MSKPLSKSTNRLISLLCISFFIISVSACGITLGMLGFEYMENQRLERQLEAELEYLENIYSNVDDDGYYNVYSDGNYVIYGDGGSIIIENP